METEKMTIKGALQSIAYLALMAICIVLTFALTFTINTLITGNFDFALKYLDMPCFAIAGLIALAVFKKSGKVYIPESKKVSVKFLIAVFFIGVCFSAFPLMFILVKDYDPTYVYHTNITKQIIAILGAPIAEELISRVLITGAIRKNRRSFSMIALLVSSIVFTVMHLSFKPETLINHMIFALFIGYVYQATGSYKACVLCHMGSNIATTSIMLLYNHINRPIIYVMCIVLVMAFVGTIMLFVKEYRKIDKLCKISDVCYNLSWKKANLGREA
jgi:membrane protease YdiL (CAAX protease family)